MSFSAPVVWSASSLEWRQRRIAIESAGAGPDLVLCHGTPWSSELWRPIGTELARTRRVHLWDMPGYGRSSRDESHPTGLDVQGEALAAVIAHLDLEAPHVVAHDIGGAVALRAHLLHGVDLASLQLVDVVALRPWGSDFFRLVAEHADVIGRIPAPMLDALIETYIGGASARGLTAVDVERLAAPWRGDEGRAAFLRQIVDLREEHTEELEARLSDVRAPVRVVWGALDEWIPLERGEALAAAIPRADLVEIPGAGHLVQLDAPEALLEAISEPPR